MGTRGAEVTHYFLPTCQITLPTHPHASPLTERSIFYINSIQKEMSVDFVRKDGRTGSDHSTQYLHSKISFFKRHNPISWKLVERVRIA